MDPNLLATIVTAGGGIIVAAIVAFAKRGHPGLEKDGDHSGDATELVQQVASGRAYGPEALVAMAQMLTDQQKRIGLLERHEDEYLHRISTLEQWGMWSNEAPPRVPPSWINDPRLP